MCVGQVPRGLRPCLHWMQGLRVVRHDHAVSWAHQDAANGLSPRIVQDLDDAPLLLADQAGQPRDERHSGRYELLVEAKPLLDVGLRVPRVVEELAGAGEDGPRLDDALHRGRRAQGLRIRLGGLQPPPLSRAADAVALHAPQHARAFLDQSHRSTYPPGLLAAGQVGAEAATDAHRQHRLGQPRQVVVHPHLLEAGHLVVLAGEVAVVQHELSEELLRDLQRVGLLGSPQQRPALLPLRRRARGLVEDEASHGDDVLRVRGATHGADDASGAPRGHCADDAQAAPVSSRWRACDSSARPLLRLGLPPRREGVDRDDSWLDGLQGLKSP
mmetsp:Transcript_102723/g.306881  ORF Transcript_102723/g.306881 Transcript_102723/m.306881 type:complete len:329 (-) Transcript_102723:168-1154(-)